jgi:hypothetical protein
MMTQLSPLLTLSGGNAIDFDTAAFGAGQLLMS